MIRKGSSDAASVWGHARYADRPCLFSASRNEAKFMQVKPVEADRPYGRQLRSAFFKNWRKHWSQIRSHLPFPDINKFINILQASDRIDLWSHRGLKEYMIPYIFLTTTEFPPPGASSRKTWLRFRFGPEFRTISDIFSKAEDANYIFKYTYTAPRYGLPRPRQCLDIEVVNIVNDYLDQSEGFIPEYATQRMNNVFQQTCDSPPRLKVGASRAPPTGYDRSFSAR